MEQTKEEKVLKKSRLKGKGKKAMGDFKKFAFRGNIVDLAIAVIIGVAFGKIITSMVEDIVMPCVGILIGDVDFSQLKVVLSKGDAANGIPETALRYGKFIQVIFEFFIIALSIFIMFKVIMTLKKISERKKQALPPAPTPLTKTEEILGDIKKLLKEQNEAQQNTKSSPPKEK